MSTPFESTSVSTDATQGQGTPFSSQQALVNGAQTTATFPSSATQQQQQQPYQQQGQQQSTSSSLAESERANFQARINNLMSEKDRAINERDKKIGELAALQNEYTQFKEMNSGSLNSAVDAGQRLVQENKQLQAEVERLKAQVIRAHVLMQKPHLAAYQEFIPSGGTEEEINNAVTKLEQIRQADLQQNGAVFPTAPSMFPSSPQQQNHAQQGQAQGQVQGQVQDPATILANLYQGRANLPQSLVQGQAMIGSTPGQINPNGNLNPADRIQQLFNAAKASSDPNAFEQAIEQAKVLSNAAISQQMGSTR